MAKRKNSIRTALCAAYDGGVRVDNISFGQDNPQQNLEASFKKARYWYRYNQFVRVMVQLKTSFFDFGFKVSGPGAQAWLEQNAEQVASYRRDAWADWMVVENVVSVWSKRGELRPIAYPPEDTEFRDKFGIEILALRHNLPADEVRTMPGLTQDERQQLTSPTLKLTHDNKHWGFAVAKRERVGQGFGFPGLAVLFQTCSQQEGMEVGDALLGNCCRNVIEQHLKGHETRYGTLMGTKTNFVKDADVKAIETALKGKKGHIRLVTNFDHKIQYVTPDAKQFDGKRYDAIFRRLEAWAMPLSQMVFARGLNPYLMDIFRQQANAERDILRPHLTKVFREVLEMPKKAEITWSDKCFRDSKLMAELVKFGLTAGPLSQRSFTEFLDYDTEEERQRKQEEGKLPKSAVEPIYDPHHSTPGDKKAKNPGRKRGTADRQGS